MAAGDTITQSLADSLDTVVASARQIREYEGVMPNLVDKVTLSEGTGTSWREISMAALNAQNITETTTLDNPQQMSDTVFSITPSVTGIQTLVTDRVASRINSQAYAQLGSLAQNAIQRKKDEDGLTVLDGATTSLSGAGTTLASGVIASAAYRISSNATEPGNPPYRCVLHGFQIKDLYDELTAGIGTAAAGETSTGLTARVFEEGFRGKIAGVEIFEDGNITIDSSDDAKGGVFAQEAIVMVQGRAPRTATVRREDIGGGATVVYLYDEYAYGERSAGNWLFEIYSDATAPTS
tara:strand:+ start:311 stop:1195 length:885 start_codon:yes stop_codon:yes gene_type:complete